MSILYPHSVSVLRVSQNKQRLFPYTALTDRFLQPRRSVFTARYGLNVYINDRLVFVSKANSMPLSMCDTLHKQKCVTHQLNSIRALT